MPIPNAETAFVPLEKLKHYLLDLSHPVGGPKARWFISMGYDPDDPDRLVNDLLHLVRNSSDFVVQQTRFGVKYIVRGEVSAPNGELANVLTVWITETDAPAPRLATAYPEEAPDDE